MKTFTKSLLSTLLVLTFVLTSAISVSADSNEVIFINDDSSALQVITENDTNNISLDEITIKSNLVESAQHKRVINDNLNVHNENDSNGVLTETENNAPVAGLTYMIANPDSLINSNITTNTVIYWLWNDGTTAYTYDPDGDQIESYLVGGINNYIIGNLTIGGIVVGFATQITVAAQHELLFQVVDENGAYSNIVHYSFTVEPSDGNQRPVCLVSTSNSSPTKNQNVVFNWSSSYDPDNDSIIGIKARVYDSTGTYEDITSNSDYFVSMSSTSITLSFDEVGTYEVWISLCDENNAWSNWNVKSLNVRETYRFKDVSLISDDPNNTDITAFVWGDYAKSIEYSTQTNNAAGLYDLIKQTSIPAQFLGSTIISTGWNVSGYIETESGAPVANTTVSIVVPMIDSSFQTDVLTDSNGYFTYTCTSSSWYSGWGQTYDSTGGLSGIITDWCRYGNYNTTSWMINSTLYVSSNSVQQEISYPVVATAGSIWLKILGNRWYYDVPPGSSTYQWIDSGW